LVLILRSRYSKCTGSMLRARFVVRKRVSRAKVLEYFGELPPCLVGIEACPSAHHWGRELQALGHTVKLIPPSYVKAYLKRSKNDANDAAAICEAVTRPSMRFVPIKTKEQQTALMLHRTRQLLVRQRTIPSVAVARSIPPTA
jgi:transposase